MHNWIAQFHIIENCKVDGKGTQRNKVIGPICPMKFSLGLKY